MPQDPSLPIQSAIPLQGDEDLCQYGNLSALIAVLIRHMSVDAGKINDASNTIISATEPGAADRDKLWISPTGKFIGFFTGKVWDKIYIWPVASPFKYCGATIPNELRQLSTSTIANENLGDNTDDCKWVIFDPQNIAQI